MLNPDDPKEKFIIVDNKQSRLAVRHLYEELGVYLKYLLKMSQAEVHLPNKDIALKINQVLLRNTSKLIVCCPNCKTELGYNSLLNNYKDDSLETKYKQLLKEYQKLESIILETYDFLHNRNKFDLERQIIQIGKAMEYWPAQVYLNLLKKEIFNEEIEGSQSQQLDVINELKKGANNNNKYYASLLGRLYKAGGYELEIDKPCSMSWFKKAIKLKHYPSYNSLGFYYLHLNLTKDENDKFLKKAVELFQEGAENGDTNCMSNLAWCYDNAKGVDLNNKKAFDLNLKAANLGNISAMSNLGFSYRYGQGTEVNQMKCIFWLEKASYKGDASAQVNLGFCYQIGFGVQQSYDRAFKYYLNAAQQSYPAACCNLGFCYENGYGIKNDFTKSFEWYLRGAELGNISCMTSVGMHYINGKGTEYSKDKALIWFNKAIELGDSDAAYAVTLIKKEG